MNAEQKLANSEFAKSARLIPDAEIDFTRLAAVNADIDFDAVKVVDAPVGISALNLKGTLRDSVLDFERAVVKTVRAISTPRSTSTPAMTPRPPKPPAR